MGRHRRAGRHDARDPGRGFGSVCPPRPERGRTRPSPLLLVGPMTAAETLDARVPPRDVQIAARHADPAHHDALRPDPQEPRPALTVPGSLCPALLRPMVNP